MEENDLQQSMNGRETSDQLLPSGSGVETLPSRGRVGSDVGASDQGQGKSNKGGKATKRSCNDCRQQKLRCDVVRMPFSACSRCRRLGKTCRVETVFQRIGKRDKYAEMQREIDDLRGQLQFANQRISTSAAYDTAPTAAIASDSLMLTRSQQLGEVLVSGDVLEGLFHEYSNFYHSFLPLLDSKSVPDRYFDLSPLLGWSIVMVAARRYNREPNLLQSLTTDYVKLLWSTIADLPQTYHVVKALCLVCFWPLPTTNTSADPTFQLSGIMMQMAVQNMLHLPFQVEVPSRGNNIESEHQDRLITWVACNIVAESTSSVYGQPPQSVYDWILGSDLRYLPSYDLPKDLKHQLRISQFCNTVTKTLYCNRSATNGMIPIERRTETMSQLCQAYKNLEAALGDEISAISHIHLLAANVHLNAFAFFLPLKHPNRLSSLYDATCTFLQEVMDYETTTGSLLDHCSNLISQTIFSAAFALLKLLNSPFASVVDIQHGKALFNGCLLAARKMSLQNDDLPSRVASRIPQLWKEWGAGAPWSSSKPDPLVLKIQFRMSVSHGYDSMWTWRENLRAEKTVARNSAADTSGLTIDAITAPSLTQILQLDNYQTATLPDDTSFAGLEMENLDLFNSMDWMLGDWVDMPLAPYEQSNLS